MFEILFDLLIIGHYIIWVLTILATIDFIFNGSKAKAISVGYLGLFLIGQGLFNGCIITDLQNFLLSKYNGGFIENKFLLDYFVSGDTTLHRLLFVNVGIILLLEMIRLLKKKRS